MFPLQAKWQHWEVYGLCKAETGQLELMNEELVHQQEVSKQGDWGKVRSEKVEKQLIFRASWRGTEVHSQASGTSRT